MQLHTIQRATKKKRKKRVGRGGTRGTYSGRGIKGQKARAGRKMRPEIRDVIKKIHKLRGYRFSPIFEKPAVVNLEVFNVFEDGSTVTPKKLIEKRALKRSASRVKVLSDGILKKKLVFSGFLFSENAKKKIEEAGGVIR